MTSTRQLAAIMFTDIVGYTKLMGEDEQNAMQLLRKNRRIHKSIIKKHHGKWLKEMGDGTLASFKTTSDAVYCAGELMQACNDEKIMLRIGIHQGEVTLENGDIFGDGVNVASRLEPLAEPGQILVSEPIHRNVKNKEGITSVFQQEVQLKNVDDPVRIYKIKVTANVAHTIHRNTTQVSRKKNIIIGAALLFVALIMYSLASYMDIELPLASGVEEDISIAVLAFDDQSPEGDQEWLGDGMADQILNLLAKVEGLNVTGKTSSFSFKDKDATIPEIGEALNVNNILGGSVSKVGDRLRISAQLVDVNNDKHIWSEKYDREESEIFDIIDEVAQSIAGSLMSELSMEETKNIGLVYKPDPEAYKYFAMAEKIYLDDYQSDYDEKYFYQIKELYHKAIEIDPDYMDAVAGLANLYYTYAHLDGSFEIDFPIADSILNVAYQKDPSSPYVLYSKGWRSDNLDSAFYFLSEAYRINPVHTASINLPNACFNAGFFDLTIEICRKYLDDDPLNKLNINHLIMALFDNGQVEEARYQAMNLVEFDENNFMGNQYLFYITIIVDRNIPKAKRIAQKLNKIESHNMYVSIREALILAAEGKKDEALDRRPNEVIIYLSLDMVEEALAQMEKNIRRQANPYTHFYGYLSLKNHPIFNKIREEPRFQQWLREAKIVHEERVRKYYHLFDD